MFVMNGIRVERKVAMLMASDTTAEVSDCVFLSNIISFRYHFDLILLEEYKSLSQWPRSPAEIVGSNPTGSMDVCLM